MTDWQPGDLALCVKGVKRNKHETAKIVRPGSSAPRTGGIYTVEAYLPQIRGLVLKNHYSFHITGSWQEPCFVKVTPGHEIKGVEVERKAPKPVKKAEGIVS